MGLEALPFEDAMGREHGRLCGETEKMLQDEHYCSFSHLHYSYLSRGTYADQLEVWMKYFPEEQMLILRSEDFFDDPRRTLGKVLAFLDLPSWEPRE